MKKIMKNIFSFAQDNTAIAAEQPDQPIPSKISTCLKNTKMYTRGYVGFFFVFVFFTTVFSVITQPKYKVLTPILKRTNTFQQVPSWI